MGTPMMTAIRSPGISKIKVEGGAGGAKATPEELKWLLGAEIARASLDLIRLVHLKKWIKLGTNAMKSISKWRVSKMPCKVTR